MMDKTESSLNGLFDFLPEGAFEDVVKYLQTYSVHLTITRERQTKLGDYRQKYWNKNHRISVNGNLNRYTFLITLLHELGHLVAYEKHGNKIAAHGKEWQREYAAILAVFISKKIFPKDIEEELQRTLKSPGASSCAELELTRILTRYDKKKKGFMLLEELPENGVFIFNGEYYRKQKKRRTRYYCIQLSSKRAFSFSAITEVQVAKPPIH